MTQEILAAKLQLHGCDITRSAAAKIEVGARHLYPNEILALRGGFSAFLTRKSLKLPINNNNYLQSDKKHTAWRMFLLAVCFLFISFYCRMIFGFSSLFLFHHFSQFTDCALFEAGDLRLRDADLGGDLRLRPAPVKAAGDDPEFPRVQFFECFF